MTNTTTGSLSDVADAQRAARASITPWWLRVLGSAAYGAVMALLLVGEPTGGSTRSSPGFSRSSLGSR